MSFIGYRFPHRSEIIAVLGIVVFVCYGWTLLGFFNRLSSFILYFTLAEVLEIFAFMMAVALLESLIVTGILVLLSVILPSNWLREGFSVKGLVAVVVLTVTSIIFQKYLAEEYPSTLVLVMSTILPLLMIVLLIRVVQSAPRLKNLLVNVQDRILIMLFVYVPVGLLSLVAVVYRNLL